MAKTKLSNLENGLAFLFALGAAMTILISLTGNVPAEVLLGFFSTFLLMLYCTSLIMGEMARKKR